MLSLLDQSNLQNLQIVLIKKVRSLHEVNDSLGAYMHFLLCHHKTDKTGIRPPGKVLNLLLEMFERICRK